MLRGTAGLQPALRDTQQDRVVCWCHRCCGEVYEYESMYIWEGKRICVDCFQSVVTAWVTEHPAEVASALDVTTITV